MKCEIANINLVNNTGDESKAREFKKLYFDLHIL